MTIVSVSIHAKLQAGIIKVGQLTEQLADESEHSLNVDQQDDIEAMIAGVQQFKTQVQDFPDFSTQTPQQLKVLRHDLRNHLNLIGGFAFVFLKGLSGDLPADKVAIAQKIQILSKGLIAIVNKIV